MTGIRYINFYRQWSENASFCSAAGQNSMWTSSKNGVCALYKAENPSASHRGSTFYSARKSPLSLSVHNILLFNIVNTNSHMKGKCATIKECGIIRIFICIYFKTICKGFKITRRNLIISRWSFSRSRSLKETLASDYKWGSSRPMEFWGDKLGCRFSRFIWVSGYAPNKGKMLSPGT